MFLFWSVLLKSKDMNALIHSLPSVMHQIILVYSGCLILVTKL